MRIAVFWVVAPCSLVYHVSDVLAALINNSEGGHLIPSSDSAFFGTACDCNIGLLCLLHSFILRPTLSVFPSLSRCCSGCKAASYRPGFLLAWLAGAEVETVCTSHRPLFCASQNFTALLVKLILGSAKMRLSSGLKPPWCLVVVYQRFRGPFYFHHQGDPHFSHSFGTLCFKKPLVAFVSGG